MNFNINVDSIMSKVSSYAKSAEGKARMQEHIQKCRKAGQTVTAAGSRIVAEKDMNQLAATMIEMLQDAALHCDPPLPDSVMEHFSGLKASSTTEMPDGSYVIIIDFGGDLHRDSLDNDLGYEGIDNIVALFNNGYQARDYVYGWWDKHKPSGESIARSLPGSDFAWVRSKKERGALHFIQRAVDDFNAEYGRRFNVTAQASDVYLQ